MPPHAQVRQTSLRILSLVTLLASPCARLQAGDFHWLTSGGGSYGEGSNWDLLGIPGDLDDIWFDLPDTYTVTWDADHTNRSVYCTGGEVTLDLNGWTHTFPSTPFSIYDLSIGMSSGDDATLTITNGEIKTNCLATLGRDAGSFGHLIVTGANTTIDHEDENVSVGQMFVGRFGDGQFELLDGAYLYRNEVVVAAGSGSTGTALVDGAATVLDASRVVVGSENGTGSLTVSGGATVGGDLWVDSFISGSGEALITGLSTHAGSDLSSLFVGRSGYGRVEFSGGATGEYATVHVGEFVGGNAGLLISGAGTSLTAHGGIELSPRDVASIEIADGAQVNTGGYFQSWEPSPAAQVLITGTGTLLSCKGLFFYSPLVSSFTVSDGATVEVPNNGTDLSAESLITGAGTLFEDTSSAGLRMTGRVNPSSLTLSDSARLVTRFAAIDEDAAVLVTDAGTEWTVTESLTVGLIGPGSLVVENDGEVCAESITIGDFGSVTGDVTVGGCGLATAGTPAITTRTLDVGGTGVISDDTIQVLSGGTLTGDGVVPSNVVNLGGRVAPGGASLPSLLIEADYDQQVDAGMEIELRGVYAGQYDTLEVSGTASLAGALRILIPDDLTLDLGRHFTILTAGSVTGLFDSIRVTRPNGLRMQPDYQADKVVLTTVPGMTLTVPDLHKNQDATLTVSNASPNTQVYLLYSLNGEGVYYVPQLDVTLGIKRPVLAAGPVRTDSSGSVQIVKRVPGVAGNPRVWLQAAQVGDATNVVKKTIQN